MSIFERLKLFLLYDGLTKEEYNSVEPSIIRENNRRVKIYNLVGLFFVLVVIIISLFNSGLSPKTFIYIGCLIGNIIVLILLKTKLQKNKIFSKIGSFFFITLMLFFAIYVDTIKNNGFPASIFLAALALIPYIVYDKVLYSFIYRFIMLGVFIYLSYVSKSNNFFRTDVINSVAIFVLSTLAGVRVQKIQVHGWLVTNNMDKELKRMSGVFEKIRVIDLATNTSVDYATTGQSENRVVGSNKNAIAQMDNFIETFVAEYNRATMRKFCNFSTLEDRMYNKELLISDFASTEPSWCRATFVSIEEDSKGFSTKFVFVVQRIADTFYLNMLDFDLKKFK